jgi:hypothetical protein
MVAAGEDPECLVELVLVGIGGYAQDLVEVDGAVGSLRGRHVGSLPGDCVAAVMVGVAVRPDAGPGRG